MTQTSNHARQGRVFSHQTSPQQSVQPSSFAGSFYSPVPMQQSLQVPSGAHPPLQVPAQSQHLDASDHEQFSDRSQHTQHMQHMQQLQPPQQRASHGQQEQPDSCTAAAPGGRSTAQYLPAPPMQEQLPQAGAAQMQCAAACVTEPLQSHPRYRKLANLNKCTPPHSCSELHREPIHCIMRLVFIALSPYHFGS